MNYLYNEVEKLTDGQQTPMVARNPPFHLKDETWQTSDLTPDGLRSSSVGIL